MRMPLTQVLDSVPQSISDQMTALIERAAEEIATDRCALARVVC
jgi:hypothetical protein